MDNETKPPRIRLAKHIDLAKAKPGCKRCHGRGVRGYKTADLGDGEGEQKIPIICRCVSRNGGVKPDEFDRIMAEAQKQIDEGVFHENLVADILRMPEESRPRAVAGIMRGAADESKPEESRDVMVRSLELLERDESWPGLRVGALRILIREASDPLEQEVVRENARRAMALARAAMN